MIELAEAARQHHYSVSTSSDPAVAGSNSPVYQRSQAFFKAAIAVAYPDVDPDEVYEIWVDCMEDVAWCARIAREEAQRRDQDDDWQVTIRFTDGWVAQSDKNVRFYEMQEGVFALLNQQDATHGDIISIRIS